MKVSLPTVVILVIAAFAFGGMAGLQFGMSAATDYVQRQAINRGFAEQQVYEDGTTTFHWKGDAR